MDNTKNGWEVHAVPSPVYECQGKNCRKNAFPAKALYFWNGDETYDAGEDLGREVGRGAAHHGRVVHRVRQPEIQQLRRPLRGEPDVAGLDVPVQASLLMQGRQAAGQPGWSRG